jgi:hypothetical protein
VSDVTDADRKKATALLRAWREETPEGDLAAVAPRAQIALVEAVAQALADEREKARAEVGARVRKVPTYELQDDGKPLGVVVLADDVLAALNEEQQ